MLIVNYSCVYFLLKFIKPISYSSVYNCTHIILFFLATARANTRGHEVTWQDNHLDTYSHSYKFAYYVKISTVHNYIVVRS